MPRKPISVTFTPKSEQETKQIGYDFGTKLKSGLLCLRGPLGAGKTTFIRGLAKGLKIKSRIVSPTFTYQRIHKGDVHLYHFDYYRISKPDALLAVELHEALDTPKSVVAVEWPEKMEKYLPQKRIEIDFKYDTENSRIITIKKHD
jgi:tRNA threonylcarbamoyladenosine biosynthesis protein TsaE